MKSIIKSFAFACNGVKNCFVSELNFRIHILATVLVVFFGFLFKIDAAEWIAVIICITFVIVTEMINTAIEKLCDVVYKEEHPVIKKVKDIAAGAVLISAVFSLVTAAIIFLPKIITYFK